MIATRESVKSAFDEFVLDPSFPCLGAKGALNQRGCEVRLYGSLASPSETPRLANDLKIFIDSLDDGSGLTAFVAAFPDHTGMSERAFEAALWQQLQWLNDHDEPSSSWPAGVSDDPAEPDFAFSFAGRSFFIIGLHPQSSRIARRFNVPALVFNPRSQFDQLRTDGRFNPLRSKIREREITLQGNLNPNLADFGESSEARQYSGREAEKDWKCPFQRQRG